MAKIDKDQKLKILLLFLVSNLSVYLLSSSESSSSTQHDQNQVHYRENYREVLIKGDLFIPPEEGKEISLKSRDNSLTIPYAIFLREYKLQIDEFSEEVLTKKYIIYVDKKHLAQNLLTKSYSILPYGTELKTTSKRKRKNYEINY